MSMRLALAPAKEDPEDVEVEGEDPITAAEAVIKTVKTGLKFRKGALYHGLS